jgi:hypothetical protein
MHPKHGDHADISTTETYLHVFDKSPIDVTRPLDQIEPSFGILEIDQRFNWIELNGLLHIDCAVVSLVCAA